MHQLAIVRSHSIMRQTVKHAGVNLSFLLTPANIRPHPMIMAVRQENTSPHVASEICCDDSSLSISICNHNHEHEQYHH
jgi:hypothetical protein